jgi:hypothetical protein
VCPDGALDPDDGAAVPDLAAPGVGELVDDVEPPPSDQGPGAIDGLEGGVAPAPIADLEADDLVVGVDLDGHRSSPVADGVGEQLADGQLERCALRPETPLLQAGADRLPGLGYQASL